MSGFVVQTQVWTGVSFSHARMTMYVRQDLLVSIPVNLSSLQTARIVDIESGLVKVEMKGHDNRVECAVFLPPISIPAVRELVAQVSVSSHLSPPHG